MKIILFGAPKSGKTTLGKRVASAWGWPHIDTDHVIETERQRSRSQLFVELGEQGFRALEKECLKNLSLPHHLILSLGGGTLLERENREFLKTLGPMIYLYTTPEVIWERILRNPLPAYLSSLEPRTSFERMLRERLPVYAECATHVIHTSSFEEAEQFLQRVVQTDGT